jgi:DHA1 family tetracycline resistance protein-like MFS transporter
MIRTSSSRFQPALAFIIVTAFIDIMSMGLVIPVLPTLVENFAGSAENAGFWTGVIVAIWAGMQFLFSPLIGALSDSFGRRPVLLISSAGLTLDWLLLALAPNLWWLAVARMLGGIMTASISSVYGYVADITTAENRSKAFGIIGAAGAAAFVMGPAIGGLLAQWGPRAPFWFAGALTAISFFYGLLILPESLPVEKRAPFRWSRANPASAFILLRSHGELVDLAAVNFLVYFAYHLFSAVYVLYANHRFGFSPTEIGLLMAMMGLLDLPVQGWLVGKTVARFGDRMTMVIGLAAGAAGLLMMGLAPNKWIFALALLPSALWALATPTLMALMSQRVSDKDQGRLQGANTSIGSIAGIASPLFFGWLYSVTSLSLPFLSFAVAAAVMVAAALIGGRSGSH